MNAFGAILTAIFAAGVLTAPKHWVAVLYLGAVLYITQGQALEIGGLNMMAIRFVEIAAFLRVWSRGELRKIFVPPDKWLYLTLAAFVIVSAIRNGAIGWYQLGLMVDGLLVYYTFRGLLSRPEEIIRFLKLSAIVLVPFSLLMFVEALAGRNLFSLMGGVPSVPVYREGYFRAQGSFRHAITAGTLGATFAPLFFPFIFQRATRYWAVLGLVASITITLASHSSGPLMAALTGLVGWVCWFQRFKMRRVRWLIIFALVGVQMAMTKPIWFIFDRMSKYLGGDGWHRSNLIDQFLKHWGEWWAIGMPIEDTGDWAATQMPWGGVDVTNYYVALGISGGVVTLVLFIVMVVTAFKVFGRAMAAIRALNTVSRPQEATLWGAGCAFCAHVVNMSAVVYFDQSYVIWYLHLALGMSLAAYWLTARASLPVSAGAEEVREVEQGSEPLEYGSKMRPLGV